MNAAVGGAAFHVGEAVGAFTDDAARYMAKNSRVLPGSPYSARARQEMASELDKKIEWAAVKEALAGGIVGQGAVIIEGRKID